MAIEFNDDPLHTAIPERGPEATSLDQSDDSATSSLYRAALGAGRVEDYLRVFARFDAADRVGPSWNWAAAVITLNWLAFRQLWGVALTYLGVVVGAVLMLLGIGRLVFQLSATVETSLLALLTVLAFVLPGLYGNAWLYNHCRKRMERALAAHTTLPEACTMLRRQASSRRRLLWIGVINLALGGGTAALAMAVPDLGDLPLQSEKMLLARGGPMRSLDATGNAVPPAAAATASDAATSAAAQPATPATPTASDAPATTTAATATATATATTNANSNNAVVIAAADSTSGRAAQGAIDPVPAPVAGSGPPKPASSASRAGASTASAGVPAKAEKAMKATKATKATQAVKKAATKSPTPAATTQASEAAASESGAQREAQPFVVNVGLFAQENNVRNARAKLQDAGLPVLVQVVKTAKGPLTRVRVGPYATQAEADAAAEKIHPLGLDAVVFERPKTR